MKEKTTLLKDVFFNDTLFKFVFDGNDSALEAYLNGALEICEKEGGVIILDSSAIISWIPYNAFPPSIAEEKFTEQDKATIHRFEKHERTPESIIASSANNFGYIWLLGVSEKARGKGYARRLIDMAVLEMKNAGLTECWLSTENPDNRYFYTHNGFVLHKEEVSGLGINSMVFKKTII